MLHGRRRVVFRCFALALMAIVAGDLWDAACDPLPRSVQSATIVASTGDEGDLCRETCVADCYCCCALDGPALAAAQDPLDFLQMAALLITRPGPSRTAAPPDQPPTRL